MNKERGGQRRFFVLRHKPEFHPITSWTRAEVLSVVIWAFAGAVFGTNAKLLQTEKQLSEQQFEPLPEPLFGRWSETSLQGWRVRQTEELLLKGTFGPINMQPAVHRGGEFEIDGQRTAILLSKGTFLQIHRVDPVPVVRATIPLAGGKKEDVLLPTFSEHLRWLVTFEHPESGVMRHFHILPELDGQLQVVPMRLTPR